MQKHIILTSLLAAIIATPSLAVGDKTVTSTGYVQAQVATRQPKIAAKEGSYAVMYPNSEDGDDDGDIGERAISNSVDGYDDETDLITVGAVNRALADKQGAIPAGTSGNLVTYNGTSGSVGSAAVYNQQSAYAGQTGALVQAQHVNDAVTAGFNAHLTCANQDCTLYNVNTLSGTYVPHN